MLNKTLIWCSAIFAMAGFLCFFIYMQHTRFVVSKLDNGRIYKTDRRTGRSVLIVQNIELPVESAEPAHQPTSEEKAISLAKSAKTLSKSYTSNETTIRDSLEKFKGSLKIIGWQARQVDNQTIVVTYSIDRGDGIRSWAFEVNTSEELVRNITGDMILEAKYGFNTAE